MAQGRVGGAESGFAAGSREKEDADYAATRIQTTTIDGTRLNSI
jgi:hypothetical protein